MGRYAKDTSVSVENSKAQLERVITQYGADSFATMSRAGVAAIAFEMHGRRVVFELPLPHREEFAENVTRVKATSKRSAYTKRTERSPAQQEKMWEQACRQRWRALSLAVKAKLEAVESGIATFEEEFLAHIMLPDGQTVGKWAAPQLRSVYEDNAMPPLLPGIGGTG